MKCLLTPSCTVHMQYPCLTHLLEWQQNKGSHESRYVCTMKTSNETAVQGEAILCR